MKTLYKILFCFYFLITLNLFTQDEEPPPYTGEIKIVNQSTTRTIYVKVYPVSMLFNGYGFYDLHTRYPDDEDTNTYHYMTGVYLSSGVLYL